eukprot:8594383-Prorocentrum_lima.AAC.1
MTSRAPRGSKTSSPAAERGTLAAVQQQVTDASDAGWTYWRATTPLSEVTHGPGSTIIPGT